MSWFSDLADKAENLLNKIDQNAAAVLQERDKKIHINISADDKSNNNPENVTPRRSISNISLSKTDNNLESKKNPFRSAKKTNKKISDMNNSFASKTNDSISQQTLRQINSFANFTSVAEDKAIPSNLSDSASIKDESLISFNVGSDIETERSNTPDPGNIFNDDGNISVVSNHSDHFITVENELLRNEISVVNNEVSLLIAKVKAAEKSGEDAKVKLRQLEKTYAQVIKENECLQEKITEAQNANLKSSHVCNSTENEEIIKSLEEDRQNLQEKVNQMELSELSSTSLKSEMESNIRELQCKCKELEDKLEKSKNETTQTLSELKNYKIRANSTLSMKEKIIEELGGNVGENCDEIVNTLNTQISHLKAERDDVLEESMKYQTECEKKNIEIEQMETRIAATERQLSILKEAFRQEKVAKEIAEHSVNSMTKELKSIQLETNKQISSLRAKLRDNQHRENDRLVSNPSTSSMNVSENGEERFRLLTHALVAKQAALESVTADRNALRLQLEKTENKYRSDLVSMRNNQPRIIHVNDTDDVKAKFPSMMEENPWDSHFSRGAKKVYSTLDSFSVRVGVFLRRNPLARIFIISYMIVLHLWVFIVLFSYTPEIRSS